jgi:hypothetical protein
VKIDATRKVAACRVFAEPSDGLEPSTPSLPSNRWGGSRSCGSVQDSCRNALSSEPVSLGRSSARKWPQSRARPCTAFACSRQIALDPKGIHRLELVAGHHPLRVRLVALVGLGLGAVAVAAQFRAHECEALSQFGRTRCHITCVCGYPCSSSTGGPEPPWTALIVVVDRKLGSGESRDVQCCLRFRVHSLASSIPRCGVPTSRR